MKYKKATAIVMIAVAFLYPRDAIAQIEPPAVVKYDATIVIEIVNARQVHIDGKTISVGALEKVLATQRGSVPAERTRILIGVTKAVPYEDFMKILEHIQSCGYTLIAMIDFTQQP